MWGKMFVIFAAVVLLAMGVDPGQAKAAGKHNEIGKAVLSRWSRCVAPRTRVIRGTARKCISPCTPECR